LAIVIGKSMTRVDIARKKNAKIFARKNDAKNIRPTKPYLRERHRSDLAHKTLDLAPRCSGDQKCGFQRKHWHVAAVTSIWILDGNEIPISGFTRYRIFHTCHMVPYINPDIGCDLISDCRKRFRLSRYHRVQYRVEYRVSRYWDIPTLISGSISGSISGIPMSWSYDPDIVVNVGYDIG
jgi:hypothetical protein